MTIKNISTERRIDQRHKIRSCLQVFNQLDNSLLGTLADISSQGIKLVSLEQITTGDSFHLVVPIPNDILDAGFIDFEAKSVWSGRGPKQNTFATGFKTTDMSLKNRQMLIQLLEKANKAGGFLGD